MPLKSRSPHRRKKGKTSQKPITPLASFTSRRALSLRSFGSSRLFAKGFGHESRLQQLFKELPPVSTGGLAVLLLLAGAFLFVGFGGASLFDRQPASISDAFIITSTISTQTSQPVVGQH